MVKNLPAIQETRVWSLGREDPLVKEMATHSNTLAWKIPWMEEHGRLQSMGSQRVWHDWTTSLSLFTFMHWRRKWKPTPVFLPGKPRDRGAWWAAVYGVAQSWTQLKRLSSSGSSSSSHVWLFVTPWTEAYQASLSMGFSRQEYWSGLPFPSPEDLPNPGIEPRSPAL